MEETTDERKANALELMASSMRLLAMSHAVSTLLQTAGSCVVESSTITRLKGALEELASDV